ncbi:MAG: NAD-dependent epimerase/dehydratase family protein, partial [Actinobacteria bacterium]|nr:NAD-dependent epimerase/dehydratase family protein [Actinomycetota bacterium]
SLFIDYNERIERINLNDFAEEEYDAIINCIGIGNPKNLKDIESDIFTLTEYYDNFILSYLKDNNDCLYLNFSSGAAYGMDFSIPAENKKCYEIDINNIGNKDNYGIAKLYSEAKHRSSSNLNIVDLRVFAFFSRFIDLDSKYFITELINCIKTGKKFLTNSNNIVRDYVHPDDLFNLINICINIRKINDVFDVYSQRPITKFEILDYFVKKYNLRYTIDPGLLDMDKEDIKENYYSSFKKAENIGYIPKHTSMDSIADEAAEILKSI